MFSILSILTIALVGMAIVKHGCVNEYKKAATASTPSGTLISYGGKVWVSQNLKTLEIGETVTYRSDLVVSIEKTLSTTVIADEAVVNVDVATGKTVASGGVACGKARGGSANGDTHVLIALNEGTA